MRQAIAILAVAGAAGVASAQFEGPYDPANWTIFDNADGSAVFGGTSTLTITTGDNLVGGDTTATILAAAGGTWSFDWAYSSNDSGDFDQAGYILNGVFNQLAQNDMPGSGSVSIGVNAGDEIGFYGTTLDGAFGPGVLEISNFDAPVPTPGAMALLGLGGLALTRRRR
jgi:MYXO-CTERM domain-containing protein